MAHPDADLWAALARQLGAQPDLDTLWERVLHASLTHVDGAEHAGITLLSHKAVSTPAATSDLVHQVDTQQYLIGEGPCLSASLQSEPIVHVGDLPTDPRWPHFARAVTDLGIRSMLSYQLYTNPNPNARTNSGVIGALNIYATNRHAFTGESVHAGQLLATHAAIAAATAITNASLLTALHSRDVIGQAKGILMERYKITPDQAFDVLIRASNISNRKLRDIAADLTATGELPSITPRR